jgi:hypothetical protein
MKLRDWLTLTAIVGALALVFFVTRYSQPERVKPGSPEYDAYIEHYIDECLQNPLPSDKPDDAISAEAERVEICRASVLQADRFNPGARPLKH